MVAQTCSICQAEASKRCGGCHEVYYCGKEHQKLDWLRHRLVCKPFKVCEDEVLGRHLVATRDIKAGEVVLREGPLLQGPSQVTGPVCLGCLQAISQHNSEPCEKCGWPLCRKASCRHSKQHLPECQWTVEKKKIPVKISHFISPHPSYECITALRMCYARDNNPTLWAKLKSLQSHTEDRKDTQKYKEDTRSIAQFLRRFYKIEDEFTDTEIMDIWGVVQVNGHEVPVSHPPHVAIYDLCSMVEHSCHPNCCKSFTNSGGIVLRAVDRIPAGGHLSICYTDSLWGTGNRQYHLSDTKFFSCKCVRCVDPTELGTYFSALICEKSECRGPVLPENLCSVTSDTVWSCARCGLTMTDQQVEDILHQAGNELASLASQEIQASFRFLDHWSSRFHRNHYYLTEVGVALAQRLGQDGIQTLSNQHLLAKTDLCRHLLELLAVIAPGECRLLGLIYFELHAAMAERGRRGLLQGNMDLQQTLLESRSCLDKTIYFLDQEPDLLPEGKVLAQAKVNKAELDKTLQSVLSLTAGIPAM
uniref:MYND-type domain-containing protein n=1 Tax=Graphocephala atropunctata TaxID=36148 RepID=A0A1B6KW78_9HEMI